MKLFTESDRYLYPLNTSSVVIDVGGYHGSFAKTIAEKYGCRVVVLEPVFFDKCSKNLERVPNVSVHKIGMGGSRRSDTIHIKGDSTGLFAEGEPVEVELFTLAQVLNNFCGKGADLLKLNCEGAEGEILEAAIADGSIYHVTHIQVQPHLVMPNAEERWLNIQKLLSRTHEMTYYAPWCWEGWSIKGAQPC